MTYITIGDTKSRQSRKRIILCAIACACLFVSCTQKETIILTYYIRNDCSQSVMLDFGRALFWDTCSIGSNATYSYAWFGPEKMVIPSGQLIRLHPICRTASVHPEQPQLDATIFSSRAILISGKDTIIWIAAWENRPPDQIPCMFDNDTVWSIYNLSCWQTIQDEQLPYTYYHLFTITDDKIERSRK